MEAEYIRWISTAILAWIAWEMRALRKDVAQRVPYVDCNRRMEEHNKKLDKLDERVRIHSWQLAGIKERHNRPNPHESLQKHKNEED